MMANAGFVLFKAFRKIFISPNFICNKKEEFYQTVLKGIFDIWFKTFLEWPVCCPTRKENNNTVFFIFYFKTSNNSTTFR